MHGHGPIAGAGGRAGLQVADIFRDHGDTFARRFRISERQARVLRDIQACRTAAMGGHLDVCNHCGHTQPAYNSCRNRHCPTCQAVLQAEWIDQRRARVLPTHHFHVVFTVPGQLRQLLPANDRLLYDTLFDAAAATLLELGQGRFEGAQLGITAVLHTWTRDLRLHPHVHCVVTGGGLTREPNPRWVAARPRFLFPIAVMRALFRGKFLAALENARRAGRLRLPDALVDDNGWLGLLQRLRQTKWVVYAKRPFGDAERVFAYLGRYTHRVAISGARLKAVSDTEIVFRTRGDDVARLHPHEFIRRFLLHVLPRQFRKIRHFGLLSPGGVKHRLPLARSLLDATQAASAWVPAPAADDIRAQARRCPVCEVGLLFRLLDERLPRRPPSAVPRTPDTS